MADNSIINYRKFWLINAKGERYDLTDKDVNHTFFNIPEGLGFQRKYTSERIGNSEIILSQEFSFLDVTGEIVFFNVNNSLIYQDYQAFISFISFTPLELHYQTANVLEPDAFYCKVIITTLDKSEISYEDNIMRCPITFHRLSQWFTDADKVYVLQKEEITNGKQYNLIRNYHYAGSILTGVPIYNDGTDDVGFVFQIDGRVKNPRFYLAQNGEIYGEAGVTGTNPYGCVIINSIDDEESIYLETTSGAVVANPKQYQDFALADGQTYLTWCKLKVGESIFSFSDQTQNPDFDGTITIRFKRSYISV